MFTWDKNWARPMESLWSIANKIAFANATSVQQALEYVGGVLTKHRERMLFPGLKLALRITDMLGLNSRVAIPSMFAAVEEVQPLQIRENWRIGLRYCPLCVDSFMHFTQFQDSRVLVCPLHKVSLLEGCQHCGCMLDPMCLAPWSCNSCGFMFASSSQNWLQAFSEVSSSRDYALNGRMLPASTIRRTYGNLSNRAQLGDAIFEEHAACMHSLTAGHLDCISVEGALETITYGNSDFCCPVAAAAIATANSLGITAQGVRGGWPDDRPRISGAKALHHLEYLISRAPKELHGQVLKWAVRGWYAEALRTFGSSSRMRDFPELWTPSQLAELSAKDLANPEAWAKTSVPKIEALVVRVAARCQIESSGRHVRPADLATLDAQPHQIF